MFILKSEKLTADADRHHQNLKLNKWGLLAAMQALSIYLLVRLGEGETEENTNDVLLMETVTVSGSHTPYDFSLMTRLLGDSRANLSCRHGGRPVALFEQSRAELDGLDL